MVQITVKRTQNKITLLDHMISFSLHLKQTFLGIWKFLSGWLNQTEKSLGSGQSNRRGQRFLSVCMALKKRNSKLPWVALFTYPGSPSESKFQLLVSSYLLSLKLPDKVDSEVPLGSTTPLCPAKPVGIMTTSLCDVKKYKPSSMFTLVINYLFLIV